MRTQDIRGSHLNMAQWQRSFILVGVLIAIFLAAAAVSRESALPGREAESNIPRFIRVGTGEPAIRADAVLVKRMKSGEVLFERNAGERLPMASLTKLMTALLLVELGEPLALVEFSEAAKSALQPDDKKSSVRAGDNLRAEDILKLLIISSDSDAAYAAAEHVAIAEQPLLRDASFRERLDFFAALMNERARALGLSDTQFSNPTGNDDPAQFSTAHDLARLAGIIVASHPELWTFSRTQELFVFGRDGERYGVVNTNPLLAEYPAIYGSKTGFDDEAKGTLLLLYQIAPGDLVASVLLSSPDRFSDGRALIRWLEASFQFEQ